MPDNTTAPGVAAPVAKPSFSAIQAQAIQGAPPAGAAPGAPPTLLAKNPNSKPSFSAIQAGTTATPGVSIPELGGFTAPKDAAQMIARLQNSGDDGKKLAEDLMRKYGNVLGDDLKAQGVKIPKGMFGMPITVEGERRRSGQGALGTFFNVIMRPGQVALQTVRAGASVVREATGGEKIAGDRGFSGIIGAARGTEAPINLREMEGLDPNVGGKYWGFTALADLVGTTVLDPTIAVSTGTSEAAKLGLAALSKTVEEAAIKRGVEEVAAKELGEAMLKDVAKVGFKKAVPEDIQALLRSNLTEIGKDAAGDKGVRQAFRGVFGKEARDGGVRYADKTIDALKEGAQGGIKIAGTTVFSEEGMIGRAGASAGRGVKLFASPVTEPLGKLASKIGEPIANAIRPRARIIKTWGEEAGKESGDVAAEVAAKADMVRNDAIFRMSEAARSAGSELDDETLGRIFDALESGPATYQAEMNALRSEGKVASAEVGDVVDKIRREYTADIEKMHLGQDPAVLKQVRADAAAAETKRMTEARVKNVTTAEEASAKAYTKAESAAEKEALARESVRATTEGQGRTLTGAEHERIGAAKRAAGVSNREAGRLEEAVAAAEGGSAEARAKAFDEAISKETANFTRSTMSGPAAAKALEDAKGVATTAAKELDAYERTLMPGPAAWQRLSKSKVERLGELEGRVTAAARAVKRAEAQITRTEAIVERAVSRAEKGAAKKIGADEASLAAAAARARARAEALFERQRTIQAKIAEDAAKGNKLATGAQKERLGALTERARAARNTANAAESKVVTSRERLIRALQSDIPEKAAEAGEQAVQRYLKSNPVLMDVSHYMPHQVTKAGYKGLEDAGWVFQEGTQQQAGRITRTLRQGGAMETRELVGKAKDLNVMMADLLNLPEGAKFFDTNPLTVTAKRLDEAYRATYEVRYIDAMAKLGEKYGGDWVKYGEGIDEAYAKEHGMVLINTKYLDGIYAKADIAPEIERLQAVVYNDASIKKWEQLVDKFGSLWAGYATTPIMFGTGFFARNAMGNMFNNFLAGISNPALYGRAFKLQHAASDVAKDVGRKIGPEFEAALAAKVGARDARLFVQAQETGALGTGFFSMHDIGNAPDLSPLNKGEKWKRRLNPLDKHNILLKPGAQLNAAIENNARLAHFLGKMDEHGNATLAARSVKKFLFDYSDLTAFEKTKMRRFIRFYTYMRKNTPLQFSMIVHEPGKFAALGHAYEGTAMGSTDTGPFPNYAVNQMDTPVNGVMFGVDTPTQAAMQAVQPFVNAIGIIPGIREALPNSLRPEGGVAGTVRSLLNVPSGGLVEVLKNMVETESGKSLFTGGDLGPATLKKRSIAFAKAIMPLYGKEEAARKTVFNLDGRDQARARLLTSILGLHVTILDDQAKQGEYKRILGVATAAVDTLKAEGVAVPTISELRDAGIVPQPPKSKIKKPTKSAAQRRAEAIQALTDAGMSPEEAAAGEFGIRPSISTRSTSSKKGSLTKRKSAPGAATGSKKKHSLAG